MLGRFGRIVRALFLARVAVLAWIFLMALAVFGPTSSFVEGMFEINQTAGLIWVSATALLVSFGFLVQANLVLEHGEERMRTVTPFTIPGYSTYRPPRWLFVLGVAPAVLVAIFAVRATTAIDVPAALLEVLAGFLIAVAIII